ncbi:MAG: hypothetical protein UH084_03725 [Paludibacteraceae bacterium]|nr:hypothetical protein [Paludibacteraceae bacterium]
MAKFETSAGIEDMTGKLGKKSVLTMRRKKWRYPDGRIFGYGPKEIYSQEVRDYKRKPRTAAEEVQHKKWTFVCQEASRITKDASHPRYSEMVMRHAAQLKGKPDPVLGKRRICQFGNFVRSVLLHEQE